MIKIYNTLSHEKEVFKPIEEGKVSMYVCGPTVYNYIHIGNARSTVAFDVIRRYLEYRGYDVKFVSNFTDVDDKIIKAAKEENMTTEELSDKYIAAYFEDTGALNVKKADVHPRVKDHIQEIIDFNEVLIDKGFAYETDGDVYYRTAAFEDYGKLSRIDKDALIEGASNRVDDEDTARKENPMDFALWKGAKEDEVSWNSPWGKGRPGWHIECSVMSTQHLGDTFDIHGGGHDLTFPHHENEIAQSEAKTGQTFANYWMHNGFVNMDNEKMSKSLGNFILVHDLLKEEEAQVIRFFMASSHYRQPINYTDKSIEEAKINLERLITAYRNADFRLKDAVETLDRDAEKVASWQSLEEEFIKAMDDDFNAANAMSVLYEMTTFLNIYAKEDAVSKAVLEKVLTSYAEILDIFGIVLTEEGLLDEDVDRLIQEREDARKNKNFARSDEIRDQLLAEGIILEDTRQGVRWKRG